MKIQLSLFLNSHNNKEKHSKRVKKLKKISKDDQGKLKVNFTREFFILKVSKYLIYFKI